MTATADLEDEVRQFLLLIILARSYCRAARLFTSADGRQEKRSEDSDESASAINMASLSLQSPSPLSDDFDHVSHPSSSASTSSTTYPGLKARLLYCKRHVAIHPSAFRRDNIPGYLGIVEINSAQQATKVNQETMVYHKEHKEVLVTWVPDEILERMDKVDREGYKMVEGRFSGLPAPVPNEEDGQYLIKLSRRSALDLDEGSSTHCSI